MKNNVCILVAFLVCAHSAHCLKTRAEKAHEKAQLLQEMTTYQQAENSADTVMLEKAEARLKECAKVMRENQEKNLIAQEKIELLLAQAQDLKKTVDELIVE